MEDGGSSMENMGLINKAFWNNKRVFITGHTGFKGGWLSLWLHNLGAKVTGYSLNPPTSPSLFELARVKSAIVESVIGDISDLATLIQSMQKADPEIIIHMAAQPLVRKSYEDPVDTYRTNIMGTVNVMEAARTCRSISVILNVTTDKCYENQEWNWGYREVDPLGGYDPYSSSKACSELITSAYRNSFLEYLGVRVATARAGNVIGGGDWAEDRLIPDLLRALSNGEQIQIRNPLAIRPWQHVLEPLSGYLLLCQQLYIEGKAYSQAWNFGPQDTEAKPVEWIVKQMIDKWPYENSGYRILGDNNKHETGTLKLDCSKATMELAWAPRWPLDKALNATVEWFIGYLEGQDIQKLCEQQIVDYESSR